MEDTDSRLSCMHAVPCADFRAIAMHLTDREVKEWSLAQHRELNVMLLLETGAFAKVGSSALIKPPPPPPPAAVPPTQHVMV